MTIDTIKIIATDAATVLGALSALCTALSHVPGVPARLSELFARIGLSTAKFSVNRRPGT